MTLQKIDSITETKVAAGHVAANTIRLLIAGSLAGSLIGMSGQNIEKFRNSCGATITVLAQNQLPLCASAHESDRVVQISGDVRAVLKALEEIGSQLRFMVGKVNKNIDKFNLAVLLNRWLWLNRGLTSTYIPSGYNKPVLNSKRKLPCLLNAFLFWVPYGVFQFAEMMKT